MTCAVPNNKDSESGSVLVLALLVTMVILAIGLTAMWLSSSGMKMSGNIARRQEALYAAEAGLDYARYVLKTTADWGPLLAGCGGSKNEPLGRGAVLCAQKNTLPLQDVSLFKEPGHLTKIDSPETNKRAKWMAKLQYTVYVRNDEAEMVEKAGFPKGSRNSDGDWRVVLRAEGTGRDQLSFFAIEAVVSRASASLDEDEYSQLGGSAQNQNSEEGVVPLTKIP